MTDASCDSVAAQDDIDALLNYDVAHAIESDAYAAFTYTGRGRHAIAITFLQHKDHFVDAREARVLAARLLVAADADDAARGVSTR